MSDSLSYFEQALARCETFIEEVPTGDPKYWDLCNERDALLLSIRRIRGIRQRPPDPVVHDAGDIQQGQALRWTGVDTDRIPPPTDLSKT